MAAFYCRRVLRDRGAHNAEIGVFYVTPCAAKIAAVKSPVGEESTPISGVINMDFIYNKISRTLRNKGELPHGDDHAYSVDPDTLVWSLTNGEASCVNGRTLAIDGMSNVTEFLEQLENDEISGVDYLELRACDEAVPEVCCSPPTVSWLLSGYATRPGTFSLAAALPKTVRYLI